MRPPPFPSLPAHLRALSTGWLAVFLSVVAPVGGVASSALHPAEIAPEQTDQAPYRCSGRMLVSFGNKEYIGTATALRRYTALTAGHILYDPDHGFASAVHYEPRYYYGTEDGYISTSYFAVLAGYQEAADAHGGDSDEAFNLDSGYLLLKVSADGGSVAPWTSDPGALLGGTSFLALGYAADKLSGEVLAYVNVPTSYYVYKAPALYENKAYYTEGGMSGGPVYATVNGVQEVVAINVAGTSPPDPAFSDVRVITADLAPLLVGAEYTHGQITGGVINGKPTLKTGKARPYTAGVTFADGQSETVGLPALYDEVTLAATGANREFVTVTKVKDGSYTVLTAPGTPSGTPVTLGLFRADLKRKSQTALRTLIVTVK